MGHHKWISLGTSHHPNTVLHLFIEFSMATTKCTVAARFQHTLGTLLRPA